MYYVSIGEEGRGKMYMLDPGHVPHDCISDRKLHTYISI